MNLLTVVEAAKILSIRKSTLLRWIRRGEFPAIRVRSKFIRIRKIDLERWINKHLNRNSKRKC